MSSTTKYLMVLLIALGMSSAYLLDGPSKIEASQAVAASVRDAVTASKTTMVFHAATETAE